MLSIHFFVFFFLLCLLGMPLLHGVNPKLVNSADSNADKKRFEEVASHLDMGGVLYGYVSLEGELSALGKTINSFISGMKEFDESVPEVDVEALMRISGLDSISALGLSSIQLEQGFRNKVYLHAPNGMKGVLSMFGDEGKPFEVLQIAPAGADVVIQQDIKLKTFYKEVIMRALGEDNIPKQGDPEQPLGSQGMMMKIMLDGMMKQPLPPPSTFTWEKVINDLDTKIMVIIDGDPSNMIRVENKDLAIPQIDGAILVDNLGWLAEELIKMLEAEYAKTDKRAPFEVVDNANWVGLKLSMEWASLSKRDRREIKQFGWENAMLAHHRPSGKLIATTSKEFAAGLFSKKPKLATDPVFLANTKGLPKQGTAISYLSPVLMTELRKFIKEAIEVENPPEKEHKRDDRLAALSMLDFFLPEGALGEAMVTTPTAKGLLSVGNSAYSHKSKILMSAAGQQFLVWVCLVRLRL